MSNKYLVVELQSQLTLVKFHSLVNKFQSRSVKAWEWRSIGWRLQGMIETGDETCMMKAWTVGHTWE